VSTSQFFQRQREPEKPKRRTACLSLLYVIILLGVAFLLAGLVMEQVDLYEVLGLYNAEIPLVKVPGTDIPKWVLQLAVAIVFFFVLQPLIFMVTALLSPKK
jgi:hypothetical protein